MKQKPSSRRRHNSTKSILRLPDLEHAKAAVLNSLNSAGAKRGYRQAIDEFVDWYCSEPRLAFDRIVVLRYRCYLESRQLAPGTINLRLGAVRRLAYEAADCGLLSADLAAGIRRVKGVKKLGIRLGNWLTAEQGNALWQAPDRQRLKGKRDRALLALLLACGLRRHEAVALLAPVKHRSAKAQADLTVIRARAGLVRARTALINTARGLDEILRRAVARLQRAKHEPGEGRRTESKTASRTASVVGGNRIAEPTDPRI
jgi:site-specific recombinase XerD